MNKAVRPLRCADDYGLGMFKGQPLVLVGRGPCYHRQDHGVIAYGTTWTERFAKDGLEKRPCRLCFEEGHASLPEGEREGFSIQGDM